LRGPPGVIAGRPFAVCPPSTVHRVPTSLSQASTPLGTIRQETVVAANRTDAPCAMMTTWAAGPPTVWNPFMKTAASLICLAAASFALTACEQSKSSGAEPAAATPVAVKPAPSTAAQPKSWIGRWLADDGRILEVEAGRADGDVKLAFHDAHKAIRRVDGTVTAEGVRFTRDARSLLLHPTPRPEEVPVGAATECVTTGVDDETYCRTVVVDETVVPIALDKGVYVSESEGCGDPASAGLRTFDGQGFGGAHTRACRAEVVSNSGDRYTLDNSCLDAGAGPANRSTERLTVDVTSRQTFSVIEKNGQAARYRLCKPSELPASLR
jgi:hypothetical protein